MNADGNKTGGRQKGGRRKPTGAVKPSCPATTLRVGQTKAETGGQAVARALLEPSFRHGLSASAFVSKMIGTAEEMPGVMDYADQVESAGTKAAGGDLDIPSRMLAAQAITLDSMFTEFARRAAMNMSDYLDAAERYGRLALKAQSNCRATLEALAKLHQPHEQIVRHVHVNDGGQAIVADQFHHHMGGAKNDNPVKQSDATATVGQCASLPGPDAKGDGMPISGGEGEAALQDARRDQSGRSQR